MKIKSLYIDKYKIFGKFRVDFDENMTVFVGLNGTGKTTILEIIYNILSFNVEYFEEYKEFTFVELLILEDDKKKNIKIQKEDTIQVYINDEKVYEIDKLLSENRVIYAPSEVNFKNGIINGVAKIEEKNSSSVLLDYDEMGRTLKQFLVNEKYKDLTDISKGNMSSANRIESFKKLYNNFFEDKEFIGIDDETFEPQIKLKSNGKILNIKDLSSGEKQIFFRGGSLLQHNAENAIILIDEPEISMHPEWQQKILEFYRGISKTSQYILSTHSPHIAYCCSKDEIRVIKKMNGKIELEEIGTPYGKTIEEVLTSVFELETVRNYEVQEKLDKYKLLYENKETLSDEKIKEMNKLREELDNYIAPDDPEIAMLDFKNDTDKLRRILKELGGGVNA